MAKIYRVNAGTRLGNSLFIWLIRLGLGRDYRHILTVVGRKSGQLRSTPVDVMSDGERRWLVAPYGVTNWVRNARAAGQVTLRRGRRQETFRVTEVPAVDRVPVLRQYLREVPITRPYFDVTESSDDEAWAAESGRHPVFQLIPLDGGPGSGRSRSGAESRPSG